MFLLRGSTVISTHQCTCLHYKQHTEAVDPLVKWHRGVLSAHVYWWYLNDCPAKSIKGVLTTWVFCNLYASMCVHYKQHTEGVDTLVKRRKDVLSAQVYWCYLNNSPAKSKKIATTRDAFDTEVGFFLTVHICANYIQFTVVTCFAYCVVLQTCKLMVIPT